MLFRTLSLVAGLVLALSAASCGKLGERGDLDLLLKHGASTACLNELGPLVDRYLVGEVTVAEWEKTWDCTIDSLDLFRTFVKGSAEDGGYTREDLQAFVSRFLLTTKPVTPDLIGGVYELKAAILGGGDRVLGMDDLDRVISVLRILRTETVPLIPLLARRVKAPTVGNLTDLGEGIRGLAFALADGLPATGAAPLRWSSAQRLADELAKLLGWTADPNLTLWMSAVKQLVLAGSSEEIEPGIGPLALRLAGQYALPLLLAVNTRWAELDGPNETGELAVRIARQVRDALNVTLSRHGGAVPLIAIDRVIGTVPSAWIPVDRPAIMVTLRPLVAKVFGTGSPGAVDASTLDTLMGRLEFWNRGQTHVSRIYDMLGPDPLGVTAPVFASAARRYADGADELTRLEVERLIDLTRRYRPLFLGDDKQITFAEGWDRYSRRNVSLLHATRTAAELLLEAYSSSPARDKGSLEDLRTLYTDYYPILTALKLIEPTVLDFPDRRYREIGLFTYASDGDAGMDIDEVTYYLGTVTSLSELGQRIMRDIEDVCPHGEEDPYGWHYTDIECFRRVYFERYRIYWDHFPEMVKSYESLNPKNRRKLEQSMEAGARRYGYSDKPIGYFDVEGFAGILHYLETLFTRYDIDNKRGVVNLEELMRAYPVFKRELSNFGCIDPKQNFLLEAAFTYTVKFGMPPERDFWGIGHFLGWIVWKPFWTIQADRKALYKVIAVLSKPPTGPPCDKSWTDALKY